MSITKEVFLAVLAMDAYNRGPGAGIDMGAQSLGNARLIPLAQLGEDAIRHSDWGTYSFSAAAYEMQGGGVDGVGSGTKLIAYRGTDDPGSDMFTGWTLGAGYSEAAQGELAIRFYEAVSGHGVYDVGGDKPLLTGHSLGGGLAGYISLLSGSEAIGFDHMPFGAAAYIKFTGHVYGVLLQMLLQGEASLTDAGKATLQLVMGILRPQLDDLVAKGIVQVVGDGLGLSELGAALKDNVLDLLDPSIQAISDDVIEALGPVLDAVTPDIIESWNIHVPDFSKFRGIALEGEALQYLRDGTVPAGIGAVIQALFDSMAPFTGGLAPFVAGIGAIVNAVAQVITVGITWSEDQVNQTTLSDHGWTMLDPVLRHMSMAYKVILQYGEQSGLNGWKEADIANQMLWALADDDLAKAAGADTARSVAAGSEQGNGAYGSVMRQAIAYSALDTGARPYGDAGIRVLFDDLDDLGRIASRPSHDPYLDKFEWDPRSTYFLTFAPVTTQLSTNIIGLLAHVVTQYAGALALYGLNLNNARDVDLHFGIIRQADDVSTFAVDLSSVYWRDVLQQGLHPRLSNDIMKADDGLDLVAQFFEQSAETDADMLSLLPGAQIDEQSLFDLASWGWQSATWDIFDRLHFRQQAGVTDFILSDRSYPNTVLSGDDTHVDAFIATGAADTVIGSTGNDLILGDAGDDTLTGGQGADFLIGGTGHDHLIDGLFAHDPLTGAIRNDPDVYVGDRLILNIFERAIQWLSGLTGQGDFVGDDLLDYSVADPRRPDSLAAKGVTITDLALGMLGEHQAVLLTVADQNGGGTATDTLVYIDRVRLTERADTFTVDDDALQAPVWIDMGDGPKGGEVGKADYDVLSYAGVGHSIVTVNGATQAGGKLPDLMDVRYLEIIGDIIGAAMGIPELTTGVLSGLTTNDALRVTGAEKVTLTGQDDVLWYGDIGEFQGFFTGWPAGDDYPHFGEIHGGAGNDLLVVRDPRYVFSGSKLDPDDNDSATAATDLRLEVDGGSGQDRIVIVGGEGAIAIGGTERDFLFNWSYKGQLWGDGLDGIGGSPDVFWWSPGAFIMDAEQQDRLQMFGIPLTGGWGQQDDETDFVVDWALPFVRYAYTEARQLIVSFGDPKSAADVLTTAMVVENFTFGQSENQYKVSSLGDLGMTFRIYGHGDEVSTWNSLWGFLMSQIQALQIFAKSLNWETSDDPLVLDLDGDGAETSQVDFGTHFDLDGDGFAQLTGWVGSDDGLLARDLNGNGTIDDIGELFGAPGIGGYTMLAGLDANADGRIDSADPGYASLLVWRDLDGNGQTGAGELRSLQDTGIASLSLDSQAMGLVSANGNTLQARADFTWADGRTGSSYELIFDSNAADTVYRGDSSRPDWAPDVDSRGYGKLTQLAVAAANDFDVAAAVRTATAAMTVGDIALLRQQAQPVFEAWATALTDSRELAPVLVSADGTLLDHGVWTEDSGGGWWQLASGAPVTAADGSTIARPTLEQVLAQAAAAGAAWHVEEMWTPADRGALPAWREAAPYLVASAGGSTQVLDYAIEHHDASGSWWTLASGRAVLRADGSAVDRPQLADVLSIDTDAGQQWRTEAFGVPQAPMPFEKFAVYYKGGILTDYAVEVSDTAGSFWVWANNLRLALDHQTRTGDGGGLGLRNYALDLDHLKDADNSADSYVRAEIVSAAQAKFAAAAYGIVFEPGILQAQVDTAGVLHYDAPIADTIDFMGGLMEHYGFFSRAAALHLASQGGLADFSRGIRYDAQADAWVATSGRELAPMFEAILEHAPAGRDAAVAYLEQWGEVLDVIYPDLHRHGAGSKSQAFVFQMVVAATENVPVDVELLKVAEIFGVDEEKVLLHDAAATEVAGTSGNDIFHLGAGDQVYRGGLGKDVYVVGKGFGHDTIEDIEPPLGPRANDTLRFAHVASTDVYAYKNGIDLVLQVLGTDDVLTIRGQFDGKLPSLFGGDLSPDTEMTQISFADGVAWRDLDIAWATSHPLPSDDLVLGTPAMDVLDGGAGNDILRGGRDSDLYVFDFGYGQDRIQDANDNILVTAYDIVQFGPDVRGAHLRFERLGDALDLIVHLVDDTGQDTGDELTVVNQFWAINTWVFGVHWLDRIERFVFDDGTYLAEGDVMRLTVEQAKTDREDAIFGFHFPDRLDGGLANDYLSGGDEGDEYIFARGYGHDVVEDNLVDFLSASYDTLRIRGVAPADIDLLRDGSELTITLAVRGTEDRVTLTNEYRLTSTVLFGDYYYDNVDEVRFDDGTVWDMDSMARTLLEQARTPGNDTIFGFDRDDTLDGGAGDDRLEGGIYSDTYVFARGHGHDTVYDASRDPLLAPGRDTLRLDGIAFDDITISRFKEDLTFTVKDTGETITLERQYNRFGGQENAVEVLRFADQTVPYTDLNPEDVDLVGTAGDDTLWGTHFAETIDGLAGDDLMIGSSDGDRYRFDAGYGHDTITDVQGSRAWFNDDHVLLGADITVDNIRFSKDGNDLVVTLVDRVDTLRITDQFGSPLAGVEIFEFFDGTVWRIEDVEELLLIAGGGRGDDRIEGLVDRDNILDGRQGDDQLVGGRAADTYLFGLGYDLDTITEVPNALAFEGAVDRVVFGALVDPAALGVRRDGSDLVFTLVESGDQLRVVEGLSQRLVERFEFADGTVWQLDDVKLAMLRGTPGDDRLDGFDDSADLLAGGTGADALAGGLGDDVYRFGIGDGSDSILDTGGTDRIEFGALVTPELLRFGRDGDHLVLHLQGFDDSLVVLDTLGPDDGARRIETLRFDDGQTMSFDAVRQTLVEQQATAGRDLVVGFDDRDDVIAGGTGADDLRGGRGDDLYRFASGDGLDRLDDDGASAADRLVFTDLAAADTVVRRAHPDRADVRIVFPDSGDEVLIVGGLESGHRSAIETVSFADGTEWHVDDLRLRVLADSQTPGDDVVIGFAGADALAGGRGDDTVKGQGGADTYTFTRGDGHDLLRDDGPSAAEGDVLRLEGYVAEDVQVLRPHPDRADLLLTFAGTDDEILLRDQFNTAAGRGIEQLRFGDGTTWTRADLVARISAAGTDAGDTIGGGTGGEFIIGNGGDDRLSGGDGSDTYEFRRGDGRDVIEDNGFGDTDVVRLLGYTADQVHFVRALDAPDTLLIRFDGSSDELRIVNTLDGDVGDQIERVELEDGTAWTIAQIKALLVTPEDPLADNVLTGFDGADTLAGGLGNDALSGGDGSDTYVYRRNDGDDRIEDNGFGDDDVVQLHGYLPSEVHVSVPADDPSAIELRFDGNNDVLRLVNTLGGDLGDQIERIVFDDGSTWTMASVRAMLVGEQATPGADRITGFFDADVLDGGTGDDALHGGDGSDSYVWRPGDGNDTVRDLGFGDTDTLRLHGVLPADVRPGAHAGEADTLLLQVLSTGESLRLEHTLQGDLGNQIERIVFDDGTVWTMADVRARLLAEAATAGDDEITGYFDADLMDGAAGSDLLHGADGSDSYRFGPGSGDDTIEDDGFGDSDTVTFTGGVLPSQVRVAVDVLDAASLHLTLDGIGTPEDRLLVRNTLFADLGDQVERFVFEDGTVWTIEQVKARLLAEQATAGPDTIVGFNLDELLDGGAGDDRLVGGDGSDTYRFGIGGGEDTIEDDGFGDDDSVQLVGLLPADVSVARAFDEPATLLLRLNATGETLRVVNTLAGDLGDQIERFVFDDGTVWSIQQVVDQVAAQPTVAPRLGGPGADTLEAGAADEVLAGGGGNDRYVWARGDGDLALDESSAFAGNADALVLQGVTPVAVGVGRLGVHAVLTIADSTPGAGDGATLTLRDSLEPGAERGIERIEFDDGSVWTPATLRSALLAAATPGNDTLVGFGTADEIAGGAGDDRLFGGDGNDVYRWQRGDGDDLLDDTNSFGGSADRVLLVGVRPDEVTLQRPGDANEVVLVVADSAAGTGGRLRLRDSLDSNFDRGIEFIDFDDGTRWDRAALRAQLVGQQQTAGDDTIAGFATADTLAGGPGRDLIAGRDGNDRYTWARGDGDDVLDERNSFGGSDDLLELHGVGPADVRVERDGNDAVLRIADSAPGAGDGGRLVLFESLDSAFERGFERIVFDDGTTWTPATLRSMLLASQQTAGDDRVNGFAGNETLAGGPGDDVLSGGDGNDRYTWRRGDGRDVVDDSGSFGGTADELLLADVLPADVTVTREGGHAVLHIADSAAGAGDGGQIVVRETLNPSFERGLERYVFADGTVWTASDLRARLLADAKTDAGEVIEGFTGIDTLEGGGGADLLIGGDGSDFYVWRRGDGDDVVDDSGNFGGADDTLLLHGVDPADVSLAQGIGEDLWVTIAPSAPGAGDGARLVLRASATESFDRGVERIAFDDGSTWTQAGYTGLALVTAATERDDVIEGSATDDRLLGRGGNDLLHGRDGADTYVHRPGDGRDTIDDNGDGDTDVLELRGWTPAQVRFTRVESGSNDLLVRLGDGDTVTVLDGLAGGTADTVELVRFVDAATGDVTATLTLAEIVEQLALGAADDGDDELIGTGTGETLDGGLGDDLVDGAGGDDTVIYRRGSGEDRVEDNSPSTGDRLLLPDLRPSDLQALHRHGPAGFDLVMDFGSGDRVVLRDALGGTATGVQLVEFADGTRWDLPLLREEVLRRAGTDAADTVHGFDSDDLLAGGRGDDTLHGGDGADTYRFAAGDGHDTIEDDGQGDTDTLVVQGYASTEVSVQRWYLGDDGVVLQFAGGADSVTLMNTLGALPGNALPDGIERVVFADGVTWTMAEVAAALDNHAPKGAPDGFFSAVQGRLLRLGAADVLVNDFDPDGDALRIVAVGNADHGSVALGADGGIEFTAAADHVGVARFEYTVSDGHGGLDTQQVFVRVRPPASATDDAGLATPEDTLLTLRVERLLANDFDGDLMVVSQVFGAEHGSVSLASTGDITFVPAPDHVGAASFRYVANTPDGGRAEATVRIEVTPVNDAPVAHDDGGLVTDEGVPLRLSPTVLLRNDRDIDGDTLRVTGVSGDAHVTARLLDDGSVEVVPAPDWFGDATITYAIDDGHGGTATAHAAVTVRPVNDAPEPGTDRLTTTEDTPLFFPVTDLLVNDRDADFDPLTITRAQGGNGGSVELFDNGTVLFRPAADYYGLAFFTVTVEDGQGGRSIGRVEVQVDPTNDMPTARPDAYSDPGVTWLNGLEDQPLRIPVANLLRNDGDRDSVAITLSSVSFGTHGTVVLDGTDVVFTPDADYWGEASFSYVVSDGDGGVADARVTMSIAPVSDAPPVAGDDEFSMFEDVTTVLPLALLLANDTDIDDDPLTVLSIAPFSVLDARNVQLSHDEHGDIVIAPRANFNGMVTLVYVVSDSADGTDTASVTVTVVSVNDDPVAADDRATTSLDAPLVVRLSDLPLNDSDVDLEDPDELLAALHVIGVSDASLGSLSIYGGEFAVLELPAGTTGDVSFHYTLADELDGTGLGLVRGTVDALHADTITGGARRDLLIGSPLAETLLGLNGIDDLYGRGGDDVLEGGDDADRLDGGDGIDTARYAGSNIGIRGDLLARIGQGGHAQGDQWFSIESLEGSPFADQLFGDLGPNGLTGAGGHDLLDGRDGADTLAGGDGNDRLVGGAGADALDGGDGQDTADYGDSPSAVQVSLGDGTGAGGDAEGDRLAGIESIDGSNADDRLEGDAQANTLRGGRGDDTLIGLGGDDVLVGGRGADTMDGGEGHDLADYADSLGPVVVDLSGLSAGGGDAEGDRFTGVEAVRGSFHDDTLIGDALDNVLEGGDGADRLVGGGGVDTADYRASPAPVTVDLAIGTGQGGDAEGDVLQDIDALLGSPYDDTLRGDAGANRLTGGFGRDTLAPGAGSDDVRFGFGASDDLLQEQGDAADVDRVLLDSAVQPGDVGLVRRGADLFIELERGPAFLVDTLAVEGHFDGETTGIEQIVFGDGTVWDRAEIEERTRGSSFNAVNDLIRWADEDLPYTIDAARLLANDSAAPDPALHLVRVGRFVGGVATLQDDGSVHFLGLPDFNGDAFFDYTVADGTGRESTATARVIVRPVNDAPVARPDGPLAGVEDEVIVIPFALLLGNDSDVDGDTLQVSGFGPLLDSNGLPMGAVANGGFAFAGTNGVASFDFFGPNVLFIPSGDHYGAAGFSYTVSDGAGGTTTANVELQIAPVNDAPRPRDDSTQTRQDTTLVLDAAQLTRNDIEVEGDPVTLLRVRDAVHGSVALDHGDDGSLRVVFVPEAGFLGSASFVYEAGDGRGGEGSGTVNVLVLPPNDPPTPRDDHFTLDEDQPLVLAPSALLANDSDPNGDRLVVSRLDDLPEKGSVAFDADGNVVFTPKAHYNGDASFYYWVSDGRGGEVRANVLLSVVPENDDPFVNDDGAFTTVEDTPLDIAASLLLANDGDPDGDVLAFGRIEADDGSVSVTADGLRFVPANDAIGTVTIRYQAVDGKGGVSPTFATFTVDVTSAADVPVAGTDRFVLKQGSVLIVRPETLLANDADGDGDTVRFVGVTDADSGTLETLTDGSLRFTPADGFFGSAGFGYTITDDRDGEAEGRVEVTVTADNSAPVAEADLFDGAEDQPLALTIAQLMANDRDPDGDTLRFVSFETEGDDGLATRLPGDRIVFTPDADVTGPIHFGYRISDGIAADVRGTIVITLAPVNDGPSAADDFGFHVLENTSITIDAATLLGNDRDIEGDAFTLVGVDDALNGDAVFSGGQVVFTPRAGFFGGAAFTYVVEDVHGAQGRAQVSIAVDPANAPPVAVDDGGLLMQEDTELLVGLGTLLANDADPDGDAITFTTLGSARGGSVELREGGLVRFVAARDFFGDASFDYTITDARGRSDIATVRIAVEAVNDAPVGVDDHADAVEDTELTLPVLTLIGNDHDPDRGSFQLVAVQGAVEGTVRLDGLGNVLFMPAPDFHGSARFDYTIVDISGETATATVTLDVAPVNDAPTAVDDGPLTVDRDDRLVFDTSALLGNDGDVDGDSLVLLGVGSPSQGTLGFDAQGRLVFVPDDGFVGEDAFSYRVGDGIDEDTAVVRLSVVDPYADWRQGTDGPDLLTGAGLQAHRLYGASGDDTLMGGLRDDRLEGGRGNDRLVGGAGNDVMGGGDGDDTLGGGAGNDRLAGGRGDDVISGGFGADTFVFRRGDGHDRLMDFSPVHATGADRIELSIPGIAVYNDLLQYARQTDQGVQFDFGDGDTLLLEGVLLPTLQPDWFTLP